MNTAPPPLPYPSQALLGQDDRTLGMVCHLLAIFSGFVGPLILLLVKKDNSAFINHHAREALNFQITLLIVMFVAGTVTTALMFIFIGVFLLPALFALPVLALVAEIMACVAAGNGQWYRYPCCIRLL